MLEHGDSYLPEDETKAAIAEQAAAGGETVHDKLWAELQPSDAPAVRQALLRAQELRQSQADPGDAYLEAWLQNRQ